MAPCTHSSGTTQQTCCVDVRRFVRTRSLFGYTMSILRANASQSHHVSVSYNDGAHSFWLTGGTTLGELAVHVSNLDTMHSSVPITIDVVFEMPRRPAPPKSVPQTSH